jgi:hypothetical protein
MASEPIISIDAARTLAHVALLAAWEGDSEAAEEIFTALQAAKPKEPNIRICRAMVYACQDRFSECLEILDEVLASEPRNMSAKSLRGFVLFTMGEDGWRELMEEVLADGSDANSVALAQQVLQNNPKKTTAVSQPRTSAVSGSFYSYA